MDYANVLKTPKNIGSILKLSLKLKKEQVHVFSTRKEKRKTRILRSTKFDYLTYPWKGPTGYPDHGHAYVQGGKVGNYKKRPWWTVQTHV